MRRSKLLQTVALCVMLTMPLAACGGSGNTANGPTGEVDPAGVLKYGTQLTISGIHFDPTQSVMNMEVQWMSMVFGTLMRQSADGKIEPWMAKSAEVVDPLTVRIGLRPNVTFTDGSAFDAEAVRTSLLRSRTPATPAAKGGMDPAIKVLDDVVIIDPLTVEARLSQPLAGQFLIDMSQRSGTIQSPKQIAEAPEKIDTDPVGAGPFTLESSAPLQMLSLRKNPDFWDADNVAMGGVDMINTPPGTQQANGLLSGDLDWAAYVPVDSAKRVESDGRFTTDVSTIYNVDLLMCSGKAPFDDKDVRLAVQNSIDRQRFSELAYGGYTVPAYSALREDNQNFAPRTKELVTYDKTKAEELLASSAAGSVSFDLHYPTPMDFGKDAEVLQSQLKDVGITANIVADRDVLSGFIQPQKPGALINGNIGSIGYSFYNRLYGPGGILALCGVDRPDVMAEVNAAAALAPDDPAAIAAFQKAQTIIAENAYQIPIVAYPTIAGWNTSRVGGTPRFTAQGYPMLESLYVAKDRA